MYGQSAVDNNSFDLKVAAMHIQPLVIRYVVVAQTPEREREDRNLIRKDLSSNRAFIGAIKGLYT